MNISWTTCALNYPVKLNPLSAMKWTLHSLISDAMYDPGDIAAALYTASVKNS